TLAASLRLHAIGCEPAASSVRAPWVAAGELSIDDDARSRMKGRLVGHVARIGGAAQVPTGELFVIEGGLYRARGAGACVESVWFFEAQLRG
ncbi:MAG TPA: hypothetical protein VK745_31745, partial [Polyangiaceae bacterium]|nr:hypothetical protein [Polyangiaceae bacterium]